MTLIGAEIPIAHSGELHLSDLIMIAPLLLVVVVGVVMMVRGARSDGEEAAEDDAPTASDRDQAGPLASRDAGRAKP